MEKVQLNKALKVEEQKPTWETRANSDIEHSSKEEGTFL